VGRAGAVGSPLRVLGMTSLKRHRRATAPGSMSILWIPSSAPPSTLATTGGGLPHDRERP
jgi:hypothetical protein